MKAKKSCSCCGTAIVTTYSYDGTPNSPVYCLFCLGKVAHCKVCNEPQVFEVKPRYYVCTKCDVDFNDEHRQVKKTLYHEHKPPMNISVLRLLNIVAEEEIIPNLEDSMSLLAKQYYSRNNSSIPKEHILPAIKAAAKMANISVLNFIRRLARLSSYEVALDIIERTSRKHGFLCFEYRKSDKENRLQGMQSNIYYGYSNRLPHNICNLDDDDNLSGNNVI